MVQKSRADPLPSSLTSNLDQFSPAGLLDFVLGQYVKVGVEQRAQDKLLPILKLKDNNAIVDTVADLGRPEQIGKVFIGFQKYLSISRFSQVYVLYGQ